jgi:hypothetical protein
MSAHGKLARPASIAGSKYPKEDISLRNGSSVKSNNPHPVLLMDFSADLKYAPVPVM